MSYAETLRAYQAQVNGALEALPMAGAPDILRQAMRYSLLAGGKRLRGVLALAACQMAGGKAAAAGLVRAAAGAEKGAADAAGR